MMHSTQALYDGLKRTLEEINLQIDAVEKTAKKQIAVAPYPDLYTVYDICDTRGIPVLQELLAAKAQVLNGMAVLKAADLASKQAKR